MIYTVLALLGIAVLCFFAIRIAKPEYMVPRCCMGLALRVIKDYDEKHKDRESSCCCAGNPTTKPDSCDSKSR